LAKRKAKNFYYAFAFLPPKQRRAIYALYAFCQRGDEMADENPQSKKLTNLDRLRRELRQCLQGKSHSPLYTALHHTITSFNLPQHLFLELIEGMESDLAFRGFNNFTELREYCYKVASVVGLLCIEIFGYKSEKVKDYAINLGIALQLTNIIRDLKEDFQRGRIYLPQEEILQCGLTRENLFDQKGDGFIRLMELQYARAVEYYRKAEQALPQAERKNQIASEIMRAIYWRLLQKMKKRNFPVWEERMSISGRRKIGIALGTYMKIRFC